MIKNCVFSILALSLLYACAASNAQKGAAVDQATGHDTKANLLGSVAGTALGYLFGSAMDTSDKDLLSNAYEYNPDRQTSMWSNPDSGNSFEVTPRISYVDHVNKTDCRDAEILSSVDGEIKTYKATACRVNGVWVFK